MTHKPLIPIFALLALLCVGKWALAADLQTPAITDTAGTWINKVNANDAAINAEVALKADKEDVIRYWSDWPDSSPGNTMAVGTVVAYEGELYKATQEFVKTEGATPAAFTSYFTKITSTSGGGDYTLPTASAETLGGIKVGDRLTIDGDGVLSADVQTTDISGKQDTLVSGTNIKTVNNNSLLGSGNITIEGGGAIDSVNGDTGTVVLGAADIAIADLDELFTATSVETALAENRALINAGTAGYSDENAQDAVGGMFSGNTETGIAVTYDDATAKVNFVVATQFDGSQNTTGTAAGLTAQYIDWSASSGGNSIANKPTLGTAAALDYGTDVGDVVRLVDDDGSPALPFTISYNDLTDTPTVLSTTAIDTSSELATIVTDETGSGALVFGTSPTLTTPNLGTPSALTLTNATGLPASALNLDPAILSSTQTLSSFGGYYIITGAYTITLPAVASGSWGCFQVEGGVAATLDPNASDSITLDGTALSDGIAIVSDGTTGKSICLQYRSANGWITWGNDGWASE